MHLFKLNQVYEAIFRTLGAKGARTEELKLRLKRLLVTDRRPMRGTRARNDAGRRYAFFSHEPPGSGSEVMFSGYEAFALVVAIILLEHGMPQATAVNTMRQFRPELEAAYSEMLAKDQKQLFDLAAVRAMARPGLFPTDNTDPVFLAFLQAAGSSDSKGTIRAIVGVCRGHDELARFLRNHPVPGQTTTVSELTTLMHRLARHLSQTQPIKRGRSTL